MTRTFTVLVHEAEEGGYWAECLELNCGSQGETLDELDAKIRESIEAVLQVLREDGQDVAAIGKAENVLVREDVRKWEISVQLPSFTAARDDGERPLIPAETIARIDELRRQANEFRSSRGKPPFDAAEMLRRSRGED